MKKKVKLAFEMLEKEMELISSNESKIYFGGIGGPYLPNDFNGIDWQAVANQFNQNFGSSLNPDGFSLSMPDTQGIRSLKYNGTTIDGTFGMKEGRLTLQVDHNSFSTNFGISVPNYQSPPSPYPTAPGNPAGGNTYSAGITINFN